MLPGQVIVTGATRGGADLQLDLGVGVQRDVAGVALVQLAVVDGDDPTRGRAHLTRPERLAPLVEEVAEGVGALDRDSMWMIPSAAWVCSQ